MSIVQPLLANDPAQAGDYQLVARLGRGAMGGVYLGKSKGGRMVAVKVIRPDLAEDGEFRERFRREADMARSVGGFWTAAVIDADPDAEYPWLATEYVPGPTLHNAVAEYGPLPEQTVRALGAGLAEALTAIHQRDLVHRDLKPANVLLGPDGPRVIDFGISRAMSGSTLTATGMFLGTPGFFSPEQTTGDRVGPFSDMFSLGAVLAFASTGKGPFGEDNTAALLYRVAHGDPDLNAVPTGLRPLIGACLAKDPLARPSPEAVVSQLGSTSPAGSDWLPAEISSSIAEHTSHLRNMASSPGNALPNPAPASEAPAAAAPPNDAPAPGTRVDAEPPASHPRQDWHAGQADGSGPEQHDRSHTRTRSRRTTRANRPRVRRNNPGAAFYTRGRVSALLAAALCALCMYAASSFAEATEVPAGAYALYRLGLVLLGVSAVGLVLTALVPRLRMQVNSDGVLISRAAFTREIPWTYVRQIGLVGRGKKQTVTIWFADGIPGPRSRFWHRVHPYLGGVRVFPLGATGGWWARRQQAKRMRSALGHYAPGQYDSRIS